jgi:predicted phage terminase large subunit-like protein
MDSKDLYRSIYKDSYYEFFKDGFPVLHPNKELKDNWHVEYLCDKIQSGVERVIAGEPRQKHLLINIPPRSLKSMIASVYLLPWIWTRIPWGKMISASYSHALSLKHNIKTRDIITSTWYTSLYPEIKLRVDQNRQNLFENPFSGSRYGTSVGGAVTGMGAEIISIDDLLNPKKANSDIERATTIEYFKQTLQSRFDDAEKGLFIIIEQRLHEDDLSGYILQNLADEFEHINIPAELTEDTTEEVKQYYVDGLYDPIRFPRKELEKLRRSLGAYGYAGQYLEAPAPKEGGLIKNVWIDDNVITTADVPENLAVYFYADTSYGDQKAGKDPDETAIGAWSYYKGDIIIWAITGARLEFNQGITYMQTFLQDHGYNFQSKLIVEPKASGKSIVQYMRDHLPINVIEDRPPTESKIVRVNAVLPTLESGRIKFVDGTWLEDFKNQAVVFPNARHDDKVDVLTGIIYNTDLSHSGSIFKVTKDGVGDEELGF